MGAISALGKYTPAWRTNLGILNLNIFKATDRFLVALVEDLPLGDQIFLARSKASRSAISRRAHRGAECARRSTRCALRGACHVRRAGECTIAGACRFRRSAGRTRRAGA